MNNAKIKSLVARVNPDVVRLRRAIHKHPELSTREFKTARLVHDTLASWGIAARYHLGKTAVSAKIVSGKGPVVVLRADIDALPIQEETGAPFASVVPRVMHACGHDIHTAALLGAANILNGLRDEFKGTVVCLFQPSEEKEPGGALGLIECGAFPKNAAAVFGLHVSADHKCGQIAVKEGSDYAAVINFDVTVRGRGGHGAMPEKTIDPIVCASSIILQMQTIVSREIAATEPAVVTVGTIHAGSASNIIPDTAEFSGTVRTYSDEAQKKIIARIRELCETVAKSFGASAKISFKKSYPSGFNDIALAKNFKSNMRNYLGDACVIERQIPTMYAEDFARYQRITKGLYVYLGVAGAGGKKIEGPHSPRFLPDERALDIGVAAHVLFALGVLGLK